MNHLPFYVAEILSGNKITDEWQKGLKGKWEFIKIPNLNSYVLQAAEKELPKGKKKTNKKQLRDFLEEENI